MFVNFENVFIFKMYWLNYFRSYIGGNFENFRQYIIQNSVQISNYFISSKPRVQ